MSDSQTLKHVEGPGSAGEEWTGHAKEEPRVGKQFKFEPDEGGELTTAAPVTQVTEKEERTIIRTGNGHVFSLEEPEESDGSGE